jgi:hypothetical protein
VKEFAKLFTIFGQLSPDTTHLLLILDLLTAGALLNF